MLGELGGYKPSFHSSESPFRRSLASSSRPSSRPPLPSSQAQGLLSKETPSSLASQQARFSSVSNGSSGLTKSAERRIFLPPELDDTPMSFAGGGEGAPTPFSDGESSSPSFVASREGGASSSFSSASAASLSDVKPSEVDWHDSVPELGSVSKKIGVSSFSKAMDAYHSVHSGGSISPLDIMPTYDVLSNLSDGNSMKFDSDSVSVHREKYFEFVNKAVLSRLTSKPAALEFLSMKLAYKSLEVGRSFEFNVSDPSFAKKYVVSEKIGGSDARLVAYKLIADPQSEDPSSVNTIVLFRGTDPSRNVVSKSHGDVMGIRADIDFDGVGHEAFHSHSQSILHWSTRSSGQTIITGHSLGGALATRAFCDLASLSPDSFSRSSLITFGAPGIEPSDFALARRALSEKGDFSSVMHIVNPSDRVPGARGKFLIPPVTTGIKGAGHTDIVLSNAEVLGESPVLERGSVTSFFEKSPSPSTGSVSRVSTGETEYK